MMNKALVLCSGGPDGAILAAKQKKEGMDVTLLHFNYGQKNKDIEGVCVTLLAHDLDLPVLYVQTDAFRSIGSDLLTHGAPGAVTTREQQRVPARNFILMALAAGIAETNRFGYIMIGNIGGTTGGNPDNYPGFTHAVDGVCKFLSKGVVVRAFAPLNDLMKHEVIQLGLDFGIDFAHTWSCANVPTQIQGPHPMRLVQCGQCPSCRARYAAFEQIGKVDPLPYAMLPMP